MYYDVTTTLLVRAEMHIPGTSTHGCGRGVYTPQLVDIELSLHKYKI